MIDYSGYVTQSKVSTIPPDQKKRAADYDSDNDNQMTTEDFE